MSELSIKQPKQKKHHRSWVWLVLVIMVVVSGYFRFKSTVVVAHEGEAAQALLANSAEELAKGALKREGDDRVNILILGKGGSEHAGGNLTDTIQVLSVDIFNHTASMLSIPRDLEVKTDQGSSKINAVYSMANGAKKDSGGTTMKSLASTITDLTIHYFVVIDFDGFSQLIDALGGITVNVINPINDDQYPKQDGSNETELFRLSAGIQNLTGDTALKFVRSRHTPGAEGSDFARSARQQQVVAAIKEKAMSAGVLANPVKLVKLFETLGKHIKTDLTPTDLKQLATRMKDIDTASAVRTAVLSNSDEGLLTESNQFSGYSLVPRAGYGNYGDIAQLIHSITPDPLIKQENAAIRILTNNKDAKLGESTKRLLLNYGYNVVAVETATDAIKENALYDYRKDKTPFTLNYLAQRFNVSVQPKKAPRDDVDIDLLVAP